MAKLIKSKKTKKTPKKSTIRSGTRVEYKEKGESTIIKEDTPNEQTHNIDREGTHPRTVGVNLGVTKNMDNYESLRVDCWITDVVVEGETQTEAFERISEIAFNRLQVEVGKFL